MSEKKIRLHERKVALKFSRFALPRLRWNHTRGVWMEWDGRRWVATYEGRALSHYASFVRSRQQLINRGRMAAEEKARWVGAYDEALKMFFVRSMFDHLKSVPGVCVDNLDFDKDVMLLGVQNGYLDLRDYSFHPPSRTALISRLAGASYDPAARAPRWEKFLDDIYEGNRETVEFMQRFIGYSLTGYTVEHLFPIHIGNGSNGKSTLINMLGRLFGDYFGIVQDSFFQTARGDIGAGDYGLASIEGRRLVLAGELKAGRMFNEQRLKTLTGSDPVAARNPYERVREFKPVAKFIATANNRVHTTDYSHGFWRRIVEVPYFKKFEGAEKDKWIEEALTEELPGILNWALEGLRKYREEGLELPPCLVASKDDYRREVNPMRDFFDDCLVFTGDESDFIPSKRLWLAYHNHCDENRVESRLRDRRRFTGLVEAEGARQTRTRDERGFSGVRWSPAYEQEHLSVGTFNIAA